MDHSNNHIKYVSAELDWPSQIMLDILAKILYNDSQIPIKTLIMLIHCTHYSIPYM